MKRAKMEMRLFRISAHSLSLRNRLTDELLYTTGTAAGYVLGERSVKYDKAGRRTSQRFVSANQPGHLNLDTTQTYSYDSTKKWLTQIQRGSSATEKAQCERDKATGRATKMSYGKPGIGGQNVD
jgi:hypothetical protein